MRRRSFASKGRSPKAIAERRASARAVARGRAEFVMKDLVSKAGIEGVERKFEIK